MSRSAVQHIKEKVKSLFEYDDSGFYTKIFAEAEKIEQQNIKDAFNKGNEDNLYDATGKAAEKYWEINYGTNI